MTGDPDPAHADLMARLEREAASWSDPERELPCPRCGTPVVLPGYWRAPFAPLCNSCWPERP